MVTADGIVVSFLGGLVTVRFRYEDVDRMTKDVYRGGRISWDELRWGRCPPGTPAIRVRLNRGPLRDHLVVFDDLEAAAGELASHGQTVG